MIGDEDEEEERDQDRRVERFTLRESLLRFEDEEARMGSNLGLKLKLGDCLRGFRRESDGAGDASVNDALCIFESLKAFVCERERERERERKGFINLERERYLSVGKSVEEARVVGLVKGSSEREM